MQKGIVFAAATALLLAGCAGPGTESGRPDIVMHNVDRACFRDTFAGGALTNGYQLKSSADMHLVLVRQSRNMAATVLLGTGQGPPEERLSVTMVPIPNTRDLRVVIDGAWVSNTGTAFEKSTPITFKASDQAAFVEMGRRAEKSCPAK